MTSPTTTKSAPPASPGPLQALAALVTRGHGRPAALLLLLALLALRLADPGFIERIRLLGFDFYQAIKPREVTVDPVVIVDIDEASLAKFGQWPWPRRRVADLVGAIAQHEPAAIGFDIIFAEPDRMSASGIIAAYPDMPAALRQGLATLPSGDEVLASRLRHAPTVMGIAGMDGGPRQPQRPPLQTGGADPKPFLFGFGAALTSLPAIDESAQGRGALNALPEADGVVRRVPAAVRIGDAVLPSLAMEMLRVGTRAPFLRIDADKNGIIGVGLAGELLPTDDRGRIWVHYSPHHAWRFVSAAKVLTGQADPALFAGKLVLVGLTGVGLADMPATPVAAHMPGVEIHAQIMEAALTDGLLRRPPAMTWLELAAALAAGLVVVLATPRLPPRYSPLPLLAVIVACAIGGWSFFLLARTLADISFPVLSALLVFPVVLGGSLATAEASRRQLGQALAEQRAIAERLEGELSAARKIQMGILPQKFPAFPGRSDFDLYALIEPAKAVGGDLYDFFLIDEDHLFFMIGDVSGKGVPASLFMALTKALYKSSVLRKKVAVAEIMTEANAEISRDNPAMLFVTALAGILNVATGEVEVCNAGHDSPYVLTPGEPPQQLALDGGPPLCAVDDFPYMAETFYLLPGQSLLLYTDGVTEALNPANDLFGGKRVEAALSAMRQEIRPDMVIHGLYQDIQRFVDGAEPADDITILAIRHIGPQGAGDAAKAGDPVQIGEAAKS